MKVICLALATVAIACPWDKSMDEVVQSCATCGDVNFDDLESQLGVVLGSFCREIQEAGCCSPSTRSVPMFKRHVIINEQNLSDDALLRASET